MSISDDDRKRLHEVKRLSDELFAIMEEVRRNNADPGARRHVAMAITALEESVMWADKAILQPGHSPSLDPSSDSDQQIG